jgi:hypothetical protein
MHYLMEEIVSVDFNWLQMKSILQNNERKIHSYGGLTKVRNKVAEILGKISSYDKIYVEGVLKSRQCTETERQAYPLKIRLSSLFYQR